MYVGNTKSGNNYSNYSNYTFIVTLIKQEKHVFALVIVYIRVYLRVFTKLFTGIQVSEDFKFRVSGNRNNRKRTA